MLIIFRIAAALAGVALLVLMLGPFRGAEEASGVSDKAAHALAFAVITVTLLLNFPRAGRLQLVAVALLIAVAVEVVQGLTGRDADFRDVVADSVGIALVALLWFRREWLRLDAA